MITPITPLKPLTNRHDRRLFENESRRISDLLLNVPMGFLNDLFVESEQSYKDLYDFYNEMWQRGCEECKQIRPKLKISTPNPHFFEVTFKPLENEILNNILR